MQNRYLKLVFTLGLLGLFLPKSFAQVTVTDNLTAQQLVQQLIGTNVAIINPVLTCPGGHSGNFEVVSSNLGLDGGIVLSTGTAKTDPLTGAQGVNSPASSSIGVTNPGPGDPDLEGIVPGGLPTYNACILEFDFVPDVDTISTLHFEYVFGSEEYTSYTCTQFNDVFAFFLSGPGISGTNNIALVPGTAIPVGVNSINGGSPTGGGQMFYCTQMGPGSPFPAYFVDNLGQNGQTIALDGFTTVLTAQAQVIPCDTYHIKLAIADVSDGALQSAVFLKKNSFSVDTVTLNLDGIIASDSGYLVEGCTPANIVATRTTASPTKKKICLSYGGTAINGIDYPMLPDTLVIPPGGTVASVVLDPFQDNIQEPGFETVIIRRLNCCTQDVIDSVVVRVRDSLKMDLLSMDTLICGKDTVRLRATGDPSFMYQWTPGTDVVNPFDTNTIAFPNVTTTYTITAKFSACPDVSRSFTAYVEPVPIVDIWTEDTTVCLVDPMQLRNTVDPTSFTMYNYTWSPNVGLDDPFAKEPFFDPGTAGDYKYILTVQTPIGCTGQDSIMIRTRPATNLINVTPDQVIKYGSSVQLNAEGAEFYTWLPTTWLDYPNNHDPIATPLEPTKFTVIGMNHYGCKDTAEVNVDIDYSMIEVIPSAFSPNGDGRNDVFKITTLKFQKLQEFRVFNRWGQEVFSTNDPVVGWDGTYKGVKQEIGVYQYLIRVAIPNGEVRTYKGDITLIR